MGTNGLQQASSPSGDRGVSANERLTATAGAVLLVLLAVEGFTVLSVRGFLTMHEFVGMLLIGPVAVKLGATAYRFFSYYLGRDPYVRKGPPARPLRLLAPVLVASTIAVLGTGVGLLAAGRDTSSLLLLHKASFVVWFAVTAVHVLAYAWRVPVIVRCELARRPGLPGRGLRLGLVSFGLILGLLIALIAVGSHASFRGAENEHRDGAATLFAPPENLSPQGMLNSDVAALPRSPFGRLNSGRSGGGWVSPARTRFPRYRR